MSEIKNGGLDQCSAEHFEQQQFRTAGVEGVKTVLVLMLMFSEWLCTEWVSMHFRGRLLNCRCFLMVYMQAMGSEKFSMQPVTPLPLETPVYDDQVRFVCMSDTHSNAAFFSDILPPGDVFLHAGDFTYLGLPQEVEEFNAFLGNWLVLAICVIFGVCVQLCMC